MSIPDYQSLMLPVLRLSAEGEKRVADLEDRIALEFNLSEDEKATLLPSGKQRILHNRIHWAKFYMTKAGLIASPSRGRFVATERGVALLRSNITRLDVKRLLEEPSFHDFYRGDRSDQVNSSNTAVQLSAPDRDTTPEEQIEAADRALNVALSADLLDRILLSSPPFFEKLIIDLLVAMGYGGSRKDAASQLGQSGDGGVDGVINEDRLGLDRIYIQAKRYAVKSTIGRPEVQAFVGSLAGFKARKGVFVTTSSFSAQATGYTQHLAERIVLIDGRQLCNLMIEHGVGVRIARTIDVKRLDEDFFVEDD